MISTPVPAMAPNNKLPSGFSPRPSATAIPKMKPEKSELRVKDKYVLDLRFSWKLLIAWSIALRLNRVRKFASRGLGDC